MANKKDYTPKPKYEGVYEPTGETVRFNKEWSGYNFSKEERDKLLAGETIHIEGVVSKRTGNTFDCDGKLAKGTYKGHEFWSFSPDFDD